MDHRTEVWLPLWLHPSMASQRGAHVLHVIGRLRDGTGAEAAQAELRSLLNDWGDVVGTADHVPTKNPARPADHTLELRSLREAIVGSASRPIWVLQAAVGLVLRNA